MTLSFTADAPSFPAAAPRPPTRPVAVPVLPKGTQFADFEVLDVLGNGAFGVVYLARQVSLDRQVALKVAANRGSEGRTMARLEHQHIVQVFSESVDDTGAFRLLCMQLVPGTSLARVVGTLNARCQPRDAWSGKDVLDIIDSSANLPAVLDPSALHDREAMTAMNAVEAAAWIGGRLAEALDYAHHRDVLHRDVKPANILMNSYGQPLLADFNISFRGADDEAGDDMFGGTLAYMSPEHLDAFNPRSLTRPDEVTERSDLYSLGIVLHELFLGDSPFEACKLPSGMMEKVTKLAELRRQTKPRCRPGPCDPPKVLEQVIGRTLEPDPDHRFASGADLAEALDGCLELSRAHRELPRPHRVTRWALARPFLWLGIFAVTPHAAGSAVNILYNHEQIVGKLTDEQRELFFQLVAAYNLMVYPLAIGLAAWILWPVFRTWRELNGGRPLPEDQVDRVRRRALTLPVWAAVLAVVGWIPGGVLFPLNIHLRAGGIAFGVFVHFLVSFTLSGLVALAYSYSGVQFVVLRILYPRLWRNVSKFRERAQQELVNMPNRHAMMRRLTVLVPLSAAGTLTLTGAADSPTFRLMVFALIVLGGIGMEVASTATRRLSQTLVALTGRET
jgi:serine/threonine protein kinase